MQEWIVMLKVTTNCTEDVRPLDVQEAIEQTIEEFDGGTIQVVDVMEQY